MTHTIFTAIATSWQNRFKTRQLTVYVHWGERACASGHGDTFKEAFANAVTSMRETRDEAAWLEHQAVLLELGTPDNSTYRRDMIAAGRGELLGGA